ncbi:hypothetical protein C8J57DRAFT_1232339 [Mycena rebaudengoi]|nr:hypothetical protein C8J57DRAFT_1232339 [Mycena rebaudengoi]
MTQFLALPETSSARALYAYSTLPDSLKPLDNVPKRCAHYKPHWFSINLGSADPAKAANVTAYLACNKCGRKSTILNSPTPVQRTTFLALLAVYDQAQLEEKRQAQGPEQETRRTRATPKSQPTTPGDKSKKNEVKETVVDTPKAKGKAKANNDVTPSRKKTKRESTNVSPAVPAAPESSAETTEDSRQISPNTPAVTSYVNVLDTKRFQFSATHMFDLSNAGGTPPTRYQRYSPHREAFTNADESGVLGKVNLSESGSILIYRRDGICDWECPGLFALQMDLHARSDCIGGGNFPSFPEAGPSTLKRKYAEISVDSDDDSDGSE